MEKREKQYLIVKVCLLIAALVSSAYLLMLGWYNTLSLDDYGFVAEIEEQGPWEFTKNMYLNWQGRFSAFFVSSYLMPLFGRMSNMLPYTVFQMAVGTCVTFLLLKWINKSNDLSLLWIVALLVNNVAVQAVLESSTYYWLCCEGYFLVPYATMLLVGLLFFSENQSWIRWLGVVLCSLYISGSAENYTPLVIMVLGFYFLWVFFVKKQYRFWENERTLMLFVSLAIMGVGFLFMLFAPGNKVRMNGGNGEPSGFMQHFALIPFVVTSIKATAILAIRLLSRSLWYLSVFPVFIWLGYDLTKQGKPLPEFGLKHFLLSFLALGIFIFISVAGSVYGMGWYAPPRANSYLTFVLMACVAYWGVGIGGVLGKKTDVVWVRPLACCSSIILAVVMVLFFVRDQPEVKNYHAQIMQRENLIKKEVAIGRNEPLYIEPIYVQRRENTYFLLRNGIYKCFGKTFNKSNEFWYPYMVSDYEPIDILNPGLSRYYDARFDIIERISGSN